MLDGSVPWVRESNRHHLFPIPDGTEDGGYGALREIS